MNLFRRREPEFRRDFPGDRDITEAMQAIPPVPWHGTTVPLSALRGQPHYPPAAVLPMPQSRAVMSVYPPGPGIPAPTPEALNVVRFLRDKVAILRKRGQLDRISDEKLAMLPAMSRRTTARVIVDEAAELLRCGGETR